MDEKVRHLVELMDNGATYTDVVQEGNRIAQLLLEEEINQTIADGRVCNKHRQTVQAILVFILDLTQVQNLLLSCGATGSHL